MTEVTGRPLGGGLSHPFLRYRSDDLEVVRSWADGDDPGAAAIVLLDAAGDASPRSVMLAAVGTPDRLAGLMLTVDVDDPPSVVTLSRGTGAIAADLVGRWGLRLDPRHGVWSRFGLLGEPDLLVGAVDERDVVELDLAVDRAEIRDLLAVANPDTSHGPDDPRAARSRWYGCRQVSGDGSRGGALVAVGCLTPTAAGSAHLGAIATRPDHRGRGLGAAIAARAAADGLRDHGVVTLGVLAENHVARRLYTRLRFEVWHEVETWRRS